MRLSSVYSWTDLRTGKHDTLAILKDVASFRPPEALGYLGAYFPYMAVPSGDVGPTSFFLTSGEGTEIREYDLTGELRRLIRLDEPVKPVTTAEYDSVASLMAGEAEYLARAYAAAPLPSSRPGFVALIVDEAGALWARVYNAEYNSETSWIVFDLDRRGLGAVTLPAGLEVEYIGTDFILGKWQDEDAVEYVRMHRLNRNPASTRR